MAVSSRYLTSRRHVLGPESHEQCRYDANTRHPTMSSAFHYELTTVFTKARETAVCTFRPFMKISSVVQQTAPFSSSPWCRWWLSFSSSSLTRKRKRRDADTRARDDEACEFLMLPARNYIPQKPRRIIEQSKSRARVKG